MAKNNNGRFNNKFKSTRSPNERESNIRNEKKVKEEIRLILFSFKDFDKNQCPPGQNFEEWEKEGLLSKLMEKLIALNNTNIVEAQQKKIIELYDSFPPTSDFSVPKYIEGDVRWGTIQDIGGQKHRVAGYLIDNVFYIVFLDKDHKFWKMKKK